MREYNEVEADLFRQVYLRALVEMESHGIDTDEVTDESILTLIGMLLGEQSEIDATKVGWVDDIDERSRRFWFIRQARNMM